MSGVEGSCVSLAEEATAFNPVLHPRSPQGDTGVESFRTTSKGQPWRNSWDSSSNIQEARAQMVLTSSSFILISFSVSVSGVGRGRIGMGLSILLS